MGCLRNSIYEYTTKIKITLYIQMQLTKLTYKKEVANKKKSEYETHVNKKVKSINYNFS